MASLVVECRPFGAFAGEGARATRFLATLAWWKRSNTFDGCGAGRKDT